MVDSLAIWMDEKGGNRCDEKNLDEQMANPAAEAVFEPSVNMYGEREKVQILEYERQ